MYGLIISVQALTIASDLMRNVTDDDSFDSTKDNASDPINAAERSKKAHEGKPKIAAPGSVCRTVNRYKPSSLKYDGRNPKTLHPP